VGRLSCLICTKYNYDPTPPDKRLTGLTKIDILLDGVKVHTGFKDATGGWNTKSARWERQCSVQVKAGTRMVTLRRNGPFPHICAIKIEASEGLSGVASVSRPAPEKRQEILRGTAHDGRLRALRRKTTAAIARGFGRRKCLFDGRSMQ